MRVSRVLKNLSEQETACTRINTQVDVMLSKKDMHFIINNI